MHPHGVSDCGDYVCCLQWDLIAGASVAFMVVPQGMAYATLAGLPSAFGLYGALMPVFVYALFGSSRELAVGPVAVTSLLTSSALRVSGRQPGLRESCSAFMGGHVI